MSPLFRRLAITLCAMTLAIAATSIGIGVEAFFLVRDVRRDYTSAKAQLPALQAAIEDRDRRFEAQLAQRDKEISVTLREVAITAGQLRHASVDERAELKAQNAQITTLLTDGHTAVTGLTEAVADTDMALSGEGGVLPVTADSLREMNQNVTTSVTAVTASVTATTAELKPILASAAGVIGHPAIPDALQHINSSSAHVDATTADIQTAVHRWTKPPSLLMRIVGALGLAGNAIRGLF